MGAMPGQAAQIAQSALQWGALATGVGAAGEYASGVGASQQYLYQAQVAANNAQITRENATSGLATAGYAESAQKMETGQLVSTQRAAQSANGVDVAIGSPLAVRESTMSLGAMDSAVLHFNAAKAAYGLDAEAANLDTQSSLYRAAASNAKRVGASKAFSTILAGATSISGKMSQYQQAFPAASTGKSAPRKTGDYAPDYEGH